MNWRDPALNPNSGRWSVHITEISKSEVNLIHNHPLASCSFFHLPFSGEVCALLTPQAVARYGPHRAYWLLREDILPHVELSLEMDIAIAEALAPYNPYAQYEIEMEEIEDEFDDEDDDLPDIGYLSWK